jgi:hypothetical protein
VISPPGTIPVTSGATQTFAVTPYGFYNGTYYAISSVGGTCGGTLQGYTYTTKPITSNCTVTAVFAPSSTAHTVAVKWNTGGQVFPGGIDSNSSEASNISVASGATRTFTINPLFGYKLSSVGGTCGGTLKGYTYTTNPIISDCTVTAVFDIANPVTVTASVSGVGGTIDTPTSTIIPAEYRYDVNAIPDTGYKIVTPVGGTCYNQTQNKGLNNLSGADLTQPQQLSVIPNANCTIIVSFTKQ